MTIHHIGLSIVSERPKLSMNWDLKQRCQGRDMRAKMTGATWGKWTIIHMPTFRGSWRISVSFIPQCEENQRAPGECTGFAGGERRLDGRNNRVPRLWQITLLLRQPFGSFILPLLSLMQCFWVSRAWEMGRKPRKPSFSTDFMPTLKTKSLCVALTVMCCSPTSWEGGQVRLRGCNLH